MDEKDLKRLLRVRKPGSQRSGWRCPDEMRLAAYVEHRMSVAEEARIERHIAACAACLEQVVFLARHRVPDQAPVPRHLLSRAGDLVGSQPSAWPGLVLRWGTLAAAAACLLLVISLQLREPGAPPLPGAPPSAPAPGATPGTTGVPAAELPAAPAVATAQPAPASPTKVRKSVAGPLALQMLSPAENATLSPREPVFRWQAVPGAAYYDMDILTEDGNVVWQGKVEGTSTRLPDGHPLQAGTKYFVWVRAHLSAGGTVKSAAVSFHIGG